MAASAAPEVASATQFGVHSEVGKLRRVMIHRPDLELKRLTPGNHDELLFDDVLWVRRARQQHDAFGDLLRDRGVEVLYLEELLAEAMATDDGRAWVLDRAVTSFTIGAGMADEVRAYLDEVAPDVLADHLIGGLTAREAVEIVRGTGRTDVGSGEVRRGSLVVSAMEPDDFVLRPLPNPAHGARGPERRPPDPVRRDHGGRRREPHGRRPERIAGRLEHRVPRDMEHGRDEDEDEGERIQGRISVARLPDRATSRAR